MARVGRVEETGDPLLPYRLIDGSGAEVAAVSEFLHHMLADDASRASLRSYAYELLAWFRFLWAVEVPWDRAGRAEARDFALWLKTVKKPARQRRPDAPAPGSVNPVTGKATPGGNYAARTRRHARAVIHVVLRVPPGDARPAAGQPVPRRPRAATTTSPQCPPQSDAAVPAAVAAGAVPAEGTQAGAAEHPGRGVQRAVRRAGLATGTGR